MSRIRWNPKNENGLTQVTAFMNEVKNTYTDTVTHKCSCPVTALVQDPGHQGGRWAASTPRMARAATSRRPRASS